MNFVYRCTNDCLWDGLVVSASSEEELKHSSQHSFHECPNCGTEPHFEETNERTGHFTKESEVKKYEKIKMA